MQDGIKLQQSTNKMILRQIAAACYDLMVLFASLMIIVWIYQYFILRAIYGSENIQEMLLNGSLDNDFIVSLICLLVICCFYSYFWIKAGQTVGLLSWRLKLVNVKENNKINRNNNEQINIYQALIRIAIGLIFPIWFLGLFLAYYKGNTLSDLLSSTKMIFMPKAVKKR